MVVRFQLHSTLLLGITTHLLFITVFLCESRLAVVIRVGIFFWHIDCAISSVGSLIYEGLHGGNKQRQLMTSKRLIKNKGRM